MAVQSNLFPAFDLLLEIPPFLRQLAQDLRLAPNKLEIKEAITTTFPNRHCLVLVTAPYPSATDTLKAGTTALSYLNFRKNGTLELAVNCQIFEKLTCPPTASLGSVTPPWQQLIFDQDDNTVLSYLRRIIEMTITNYEAGSSFGCCSRFNKCQQSGHCLHENLLYAKGCALRNRLQL